MTAQVERKEFQAEVKQLLDLVIHSLYTHQEIFLRELVSNASDALDKLRHEALKRPELLPEGEELCVRFELDAEAGTLSVLDDGIGMDREDLERSLGTIASSGTRRFLEELRAQGEQAGPELIGQFGVGFYASFMVADEVVVETRKAGDETGWRWRSTADGSYEIEELPGLARGTRVELRLKEEARERYLHEHELRALVRRYSDYVEYPIRLGDDVLNSMKPIWTRPKGEITEDEHAEFYKHLTHDFQPPLETIHFKAEGTLEYTALLYVPRARPLDLFSERANRSRLSLYVRRVQVSEECEDLLPPWLRFVRGVVEASDLPLNVSREVMQSNPHVRAIRKRLVKKVESTLEELCEKDRARYEEFWEAFGPVLKEGVCAHDDPDGRLVKLLLFRSTAGEAWTSLAEYAARMPAGQEALYYVTGGERAALEAAPHLEAFRKQGYEVLFLTDPIDEWLIDALGEFEGKRLESVHAADASLASEEERAALAERQGELAELFAKLAEHYGDAVEEVRLTTRLCDSPGVLVSKAGAPRPHMERLMRELHGGAPPSARILELNAEHPVVQRLAALAAEGADDARLFDFADLLYGQALLAEGKTPPDPAHFAKLVGDLLAR